MDDQPRAAISRGDHRRPPDGLVRLSIDIEDASDLIEDLDRALNRARG